MLGDSTQRGTRPHAASALPVLARASMLRSACKHLGAIVHPACSCTQPSALRRTSRTLDAPWHGVFALPEHPQRAGQLMLTSEWRQATHRDPPIAAPHDVALALGRTFLFLEAQRSGALPADGRVWWRGNSTLHDGDVLGWDLEGGWFEGDSALRSYRLNHRAATYMTDGLHGSTVSALQKAPLACTLQLEVEPSYLQAESRARSPLRTPPRGFRGAACSTETPSSARVSRATPCGTGACAKWRGRRRIYSSASMSVVVASSSLFRRAAAATALHTHM